MFKLSTLRLDLLPLDEYNLELSIKDFNELEKNLELTVTDENIGIREKNVYKIRLEGVKNNPTNYMWYTTWVMISKEENRIVGAIMIKGYPNENGEVIIGYAMQDGYKHKGYMLEALKSLTQWIFLNPDVKCIVAETVKSNVPSQELLKKIGMAFYKEEDEFFWWKLQL
jgi:[ribosomal protein S5]-alanine N-acetyltransferase